MRILFLLVLFISCLIVQAQVQGKRGFFLGLRMGYGAANGLCLSCGEKWSIPGYTFGAEAGYRLNRRFALSLGPYYWIEGNGMFEDNTFTRTKAHNSRLHFMANGYFFPFSKGEAFLKTGVGFGNYFFTPERRMIVDSGDSTYSSLTNTGFTWTVGFGYQIRLSPVIVLKPEFALYHTTIGTLKATTGETIRNDKPSVIKEFSVGLYVFPSPDKK